MAEKEYPVIGDRVRITGKPEFEGKEGKVIDLQDWVDMSDGGISGTSVIVRLDDERTIPCDSLSGLYAEKITAH